MTTGLPVLAMLLLAQSAPPASSQDYLTQGLKALDANQPAAAEPLLRKAVDADASDIQAHFNLALVLGMLGKDPEAVAAYRKTLELKPRLYEADLNLGILLLRDKQPADALPVLQEASELRPAEFRSRLFYAQALADTGDFQHAEQRYREALVMDPKSPGANLGIARALLKQGNLEDSAPFLRAAVSLDPKYKPALLELGSEYDKAENNTEAIAIYREFPENPSATKRLTELLLETNNATAAIPNLEAAVQREPTTQNREALIDAYRQVGQKAKMLAQLKLAVAGDAKNYDLHMSYGRNLRDARDFAGSAREFQAASNLKSDSVASLNELAGVLILDGQFDEGLAALDRVKALGKEIPGDMYLRAITLDRLHRNKPALAAYKDFLGAANGKFPNEEFISRQRAHLLERELAK